MCKKENGSEAGWAFQNCLCLFELVGTRTRTLASEAPQGSSPARTISIMALCMPRAGRRSGGGSERAHNRRQTAPG